MSRTRSAILCVLALACALLGAGVIAAASSVSWTPASAGLPATGSVRDVAFGDVNNDGRPEIVAAFSGAPGLAVYTRDDLGVWSANVISTTSFERVALEDFSGDGHLDIFAIRGGLGLTAWLGNGAGSWELASGVGDAHVFRSLAAGEAHLDGRAEFFITGPEGFPIVVYEYYILNYFVGSAIITPTGDYNEIAVAYVNDDAYPDVAATSNITGVHFWRSTGPYEWTPARTGLPTTGGYRGVALGDLDNDSRPELVASRIGLPPNGGIFVYDWNDTANTWSLAANQISTTVSYGRIQIRDINNDGWQDVVAVGYPTGGGQGLAAWLSGPAGFTAAPSPAVTVTLGSFSLADFNTDGLLDIAAGDSSAGGVSAWRGSGVRQPLGNWLQVTSPVTTGSPLSVGYGDLNRDGYLDVVLPNGTSGLEGWLGDGGNTWSECGALSKNVGSGQYGDVVAGVFPQVGQDTSIMAARTDDGGITFITSVNCAGGLVKVPITTTGSYRGLSAGDIFRYGNLAVVAAPAVDKGGLKLWELESGVWGPAASLAISATIEDTALGDVDHDGALEIVTASSGGAGVSVYDPHYDPWSEPTWTRQILTATGEYYAVAVGDVNNDGHPDIIAAKNGASTGIDVFIGGGSANTWSRRTGPDTAGQYFGLDLADFNHDGNLDILAARDGAGVMVWAGNGAGFGAGAWTPVNLNLPTSGYYYSARFGPIDRDGNPDILATRSGFGLRMWFSRGFAAYLPVVLRQPPGQ